VLYRNFRGQRFKDGREENNICDIMGGNSGHGLYENMLYKFTPRYVQYLVLAGTTYE